MFLCGENTQCVNIWLQLVHCCAVQERSCSMSVSACVQRRAVRNTALRVKSRNSCVREERGVQMTGRNLAVLHGDAADLTARRFRCITVVLASCFFPCLLPSLFTYIPSFLLTQLALCSQISGFGIILNFKVNPVGFMNNTKSFL